MKPFSARGLLLLSLAIMLPASAHDTWLLPAAAGTSAELRLEFTSGMAFPQLDYGPKAERVERAWGGGEGLARALPAPRRNEKALVFRTPAPGLPAAYAVQLKPKVLDMPLAEVGHYFDEIHAAPALREHWQRQPEPRRWREEYRKHAKTLVSGAARCPTLGATALGLGLELLIEADVCALVPGAEIPVQAVEHGLPKAGLAVALVGSGGKEQAAITTDSAGRGRFRLPASGPWLLRATELRPAAADRPELDWQSAFTTLTLSVR